MDILHAGEDVGRHLFEEKRLAREPLLPNDFSMSFTEDELEPSEDTDVAYSAHSVLSDTFITTNMRGVILASQTFFNISITSLRANSKLVPMRNTSIRISNRSYEQQLEKFTPT